MHFGTSSQALEAAEAEVSAVRRRLHQKIDFGYSVSESLRAREREISAKRRELHQRIDDLQQVLGMRKDRASVGPEARVGCSRVGDRERIRASSVPDPRLSVPARPGEADIGLLAYEQHTVRDKLRRPAQSATSTLTSH